MSDPPSEAATYEDYGWIRPRKRPAAYPPTEQQLKIAKAGQLIAERCTGKEGDEFAVCRTDVLHEVFPSPPKPSAPEKPAPPEAPTDTASP